MATTPNSVFDKAPRNPFNRFHSAKKAAAVLASEKDGELIYEQFPFTPGELYRHVQFEPLANNNATPQDTDTPMAEEEGKNSKETSSIHDLALQSLDINTLPSQTKPNVPSNNQGHFLSPTPKIKLPKSWTPEGGTLMTANRKIDITIKDENGEKVAKTLFFLSPERDRKKNRESLAHKPRGKTKEIKKRNRDLIDKGESPLPETNTTTKGGDAVLVTSVAKRQRADFPGQISVMNNVSANEAILIALEENKKKYSEETFNLLQTLAKNFALEWLHCLAFSLAPEEINPQIPTNLGCGPKWINTYMMVLEKVALHFSKLHPGAVSVTPTFKMLGAGHIIDELSYSVRIKNNNKEITLENSIKVLRLPTQSNWSSDTDNVFTKFAVQQELSNESHLNNRTVFKKSAV